MPDATTDRRRREEAEAQMTLERSGAVFVLSLNGTPHKANVFSLPLVERLDRLLDEVEHYHHGSGTTNQQTRRPCSLVIVGRGARFFSAGFDLGVMQGPDPSAKPRLVGATWRVLARLLVFPVPTVCVINGHAFGLGLFLALACDHRVMAAGSSSKARLCLPEIHIGMPLGPGFAALAKAKMAGGALRTAALTGKRWTAEEAKKAGIVDAVVPSGGGEGELVPAPVRKLAESLAPTSKLGNLPLIKMELYRETHDAMLRASRDEAQRSRL